MSRPSTRLSITLGHLWDTAATSMLDTSQLIYRHINVTFSGRTLCALFWNRLDGRARPKRNQRWQPESGEVLPVGGCLRLGRTPSRPKAVGGWAWEGQKLPERPRGRHLPGTEAERWRLGIRGPGKKPGALLPLPVSLSPSPNFQGHGAGLHVAMGPPRPTQQMDRHDTNTQHHRGLSPDMATWSYASETRALQSGAPVRPPKVEPP